jgi:hypothetical protein
MTGKEYNEAAIALHYWFRSQGIQPADALIISGRLSASALGIVCRSRGLSFEKALEAVFKAFRQSAQEAYDASAEWKKEVM